MTKPDWEAIETAYRAGVMSLREIASQHGVSAKALSVSAPSVTTGRVTSMRRFSKRLMIWYANRRYANRYATKAL